MKHTTSGQGATNKKKWHLFDFMQFLLPASSTGASSGNLITDTETQDPPYDDEAEQTSPAIPASPASLQSQESIPSTVSNSQQRKRKATTQRPSDVDLEILKAFKAPEQEPRVVDDNDLFFKSLLPTMKSLDTLQTMRFRMDVQRLLLDYLDTAHSRTTTSTPSPVNLPRARPSMQASATYPRYGTLQMTASNVEHANDTLCSQAVYQDDTYFTQGSQY